MLYGGDRGMIVGMQNLFADLDSRGQGSLLEHEFVHGAANEARRRPVQPRTAWLAAPSTASPSLGPLPARQVAVEVDGEQVVVQFQFVPMRQARGADRSRWRPVRREGPPPDDLDEE